MNENGRVPNMKKTSKRLWMKRFAAVACAGVLCFGAAGLAGCSSSSDDGDTQAAEQTTRVFTDSLGREVELPANITAIAPSGHTANQILLTFAPEKMVCLSQELSDDQLKYFDDSLADLPITGAAFGAKGDMNKESVAAAAPQVIIDTGEAKNGLTEDLDNLQEQMGVPVVFIETNLDGYGTAYRMLGELLGMEDRGEEMATYCENAYNETKTVMDAIPAEERVNVAYLLGDAGLNAIAKDSYQSTVIDMCANNVVVVDNPSGSGAGQEISLEQIAVWNPEMIVFGGKSIYDTVGDDAAWAQIDAIANDNYYEVPTSPWTWLNNPPTVNQILGMQWFPRLCYPDAFDTSMQDVVTDYYKLFYNYDLSDAEYQELTAKAQPKA